MSILKVARMGHPVLRKKARELKADEIKSERIQRLIEDMIETMHEYDGVGLAAPQVHESVRLCIIEFDLGSERYKDAGKQSLLVCINPKITVLDEETSGFWEGCLSVPGKRDTVLRATRVIISYRDPVSWDILRDTVDGFTAVIFQHETDHLNGKLYID